MVEITWGEVLNTIKMRFPNYHYEETADGNVRTVRFGDAALGAFYATSGAFYTVTYQGTNLTAHNPDFDDAFRILSAEIRANEQEPEPEPEPIPDKITWQDVVNLVVAYFPHTTPEMSARGTTRWLTFEKAAITAYYGLKTQYVMEYDGAFIYKSTDFHEAYAKLVEHIQLVETPKEKGFPAMSDKLKKITENTKESVTKGARTGVASIAHTELIDTTIMNLVGEHREMFEKLPRPVRELVEAVLLNALASGFENLPHAKNAEYVTGLVVEARSRDVTELYLADKVKHLTNLFGLFGGVKVP